MKNRVYIVVSLLVMACLSLSCTEDMKYKDGKVGSVERFILPETDYFAELKGGSGVAVDFSWSPAMTEDGNLPQYEVVFYKSSGGQELARYDAGMKNSTTITHKELNRIASLSNIEAGEAGDIYWSVTASRGVNQTMATASPRKLIIKRLSGFSVIPTELYLAGSASESGDVISDARKFRAVGSDEGEFELYTELKAGEFSMLSAREGDDIRNFIVTNGILEEAAGGSTAPAAGVYRINVDFNVKSFVIQKVTNIRLWFAPKTDETNVNLAYQGGGIWKLTEYTITLKQEGWGLDGRYNFHAFVADNPWEKEIWGSVNKDNNPPSSLEGDYFKIIITPYIGDLWWDYTYKFMESINGKKANMYVNMSGDTPAYMHTIEILD